jgi:quercetin dioxygenase-like cupin family protein
MNKKSVIAKYRKEGLIAKHIVDKPGTLYPPHRHGEVRLCSLSGAVKIKLGTGQWQDLKPGQELVINRNQVHEAVVGAEGWEYIFAYGLEEAEKFGIS